jgi:tetratricopeptide (TPR) repeat protein/transcriptional regulator with XRE-family HTH domain
MTPQHSGEEPDRYPTALQQFANRLGELRERRGLSAAQIQEMTRGPDGKSVVSRATFLRLLKGIGRPSIPVAQALDEVLGARGSLAVFAEPARAEPYLHLPPRPPHFVGRSSLLSRLSDIVATASVTSPPQVLILTGPPGVGKTALALQWANSRHDMFDTVLWADLRGFAPGHPADHGEVLASLIRGLGLPTDRIPGDLAQRRELLVQQMRTRAQRVLVVLDNARDSAQVREVLPDVPGTTVLITSRVKLSALVLDANAVQLQVNPLDDDDGTRLVIDCIGHDRAEKEPEAVLRLVSLCGSFPLALRIATERIAAHEQKSLRDHVQEFADRGHRLQMLQLDDEDEDDEGIGVRAAFDLSYMSLPAEIARMFRLLSVHPGAEFSLAAAAAMAGTSVGEAELALDALVQAHLLEQLPGQIFSFHDLLQVYAADVRQQTPTDANDDATGRLVEWYLHTVNAASWALTPGRDHHVRLPSPSVQITPGTFASPADAVRWCTRELSNIVSIAQLALDTGYLSAAWRIPVDLFDFFTFTRPMDSWIRAYELALQAACASGHALRAAEAAEKLAEGRRRRGEFELAAEMASYAVETAKPHGPSPSLGYAVLGAGNDARLRGDPGSATAHIEHAVELFVTIGLRVGEASARYYLGLAHLEADEVDKALVEGSLSFEMFQADNDVHGAANAGLCLARIHRRCGRRSQARQFCERAVHAYEVSGDAWGQADALGELAAVQSDLGEREKALRTLHRALRMVCDNDPAKAAELQAEINALAESQSPESFST